jgi:hypothetical protein
MNSIKPAYEYFVQKNELGATDSKRLMRVIEKLDKNNCILKSKIIAMFFKDSKDSDSAFRNYTKRVQDALALVKKSNKDDDNIQTLFINTLTIEKEKKS